MLIVIISTFRHCLSLDTQNMDSVVHESSRLKKFESIVEKLQIKSSKSMPMFPGAKAVVAKHSQSPNAIPSVPKGKLFQSTSMRNVVENPKATKGSHTSLAITTEIPGIDGRGNLLFSLSFT